MWDGEAGSAVGNMAVAPLVVVATVGILGLKASSLLMIPALTGICAVAILCRSIVFVGIGSFVVLFMHQCRGAGETLASASLFVFYIGGAFETAIGGYLARRWQWTTVLRWVYLVAVPVVAGMLLIPGPVAWIFIAAASIVLYVPFSLHGTLGQNYMPWHLGTASGVTLGLAVSVGGLASPAIGALADRVSLEHALLPLIVLPAIAWLVLLGVKDPHEGAAAHGQASESSDGRAEAVR